MLQSYSNFAKSFDPSLKIQASNKIHLKFNLSFIQVFPDIRSWRITTQQAFFTSLRLAETSVTCQTLSIDLLTVRYRRPTPISSTSPLRSPLLILLNLGREPSIPPPPPPSSSSLSFAPTTKRWKKCLFLGRHFFPRASYMAYRLAYNHTPSPLPPTVLFGMASHRRPGAADRPLITSRSRY